MLRLNETDIRMVSDIAESIRKKCKFPQQINDFSLLTTGRADPEHNFETAVSFVRTMFDMADSKLSTPKEKAITYGIASHLLVTDAEFTKYIKLHQNKKNQINLQETSKHFGMPVDIIRNRGCDLKLLPY